MRLFLASVMFLFLSGCMSTTGVEAQLNIDCTGHYLKVKDQEFRVCNKEILEDLKQEDKVLVRMKKIDNCSSDEIVCMMFHPYEYDVKVQFLRKI
ncbi:MAG: hypothetical protein EP305_06555 [Bacteroidetes bacterium]|nr:MAG: hypothetical protein EP305_06555 [Bacteroidota bacterium]